LCELNVILLARFTDGLAAATLDAPSALAKIIPIDL